MKLLDVLDGHMANPTIDKTVVGYVWDHMGYLWDIYGLKKIFKKKNHPAT